MRPLRASVFTAAWLALVSGPGGGGLCHVCRAGAGDAVTRPSDDLETQALLFLEQIQPASWRAEAPADLQRAVRSASPI